MPTCNTTNLHKLQQVSKVPKAMLLHAAAAVNAEQNMKMWQQFTNLASANASETRLALSATLNTCQQQTTFLT